MVDTLKKTFIRIFLQLASNLLILVVLLEGSLAVINHSVNTPLKAGYGLPSDLEFDLEALYRTKPNLRMQGSKNYMMDGRIDLFTNSDGMRDDEVPQKSPGERRIACFGSSGTFGFRIGSDDTFPTLLQQNLRATYQKELRVINCGVVGYTSFQGLVAWNRLKTRYAPDVVVIFYLWNDVIQRKIEDRRIYPAPTLSRLLAWSETFNLAMAIYAQKRTTLTATQEPLNRVSLEDYHHNLTSIVSDVTAKGGSAVIINPWAMQEAPDVSKYRAVLRRVADENRKTHIADVKGLFDRLDNPGEYYLDGTHPNRRGNEKIAALLQSIIEGQALVPSGAKQVAARQQRGKIGAGKMRL